MMGETGPCGPCSEIHVDLTPAGDTKGILVNKGDARCIEIWNLVFIQFNANADGSFSPLPARHVDTGMGFERVTGIIQNTRGFTDFSTVISNYETDIFRPLFDQLEKLSGKKYRSTLPSSSASAPLAEAAARDARQGDRDGRDPRTQNPPQNIPGSAVVSTAPAGVPPAESGDREAQQIPGTVYHRRRLPHFERPWAKYMVSFSTREHQSLSPAARDIVLKSLLFGHEQRRYQLYAACVMPDHVHILFEPQIKQQDKDGKPVFWPLPELLHSIKSFSAHEINKLEQTAGQIWENEFFDRLIRGDADLEEKFHYICRNPWDVGVVSLTENYRWLWTPEAPGTAARDARQSDRDGRAPQTQATPLSVPGSAVVSTAPAGVPPAESGAQIEIDVAFRVIADHIRTLSFSIADGILPGNNDRHYVLRRILRRAVRYGRALGFHEPFFYKLVEVLAVTMGDVFPGLREKQSHIEEVIRSEEEAFNKTLDRGIEIFNEYTTAPASQNTAPRAIPGAIAFMLYDTYGFPLDLTELMARERGWSVDSAEFDKLMDEQRARGRAAQKKEIIAASTLDTSKPTRFIGFEQTRGQATVLEAVHLKDKIAATVDTSPFYAEMGGQVGDTGELQAGEKVFQIVNTQKAANTFLHILAGEEAPPPGAAVELRVNLPRRAAIQRHHTVTHLLHWALHEVVSADATQKGSYVGPDKLTFDFSSAPLSPGQVSDVEKLVNERVLENAGIGWTEVPYAEVKGRKDVMQFFGEKYGDVVRVVQIGGKGGSLDGYSMELCGGTHARATGEIGLFRIMSESAVAAGIRRIEAVAGLRAYEKTREETALISTVAGKVNSPAVELERKIDSLLAQQKDLEKQLHSARQKQAVEIARGLAAKANQGGATPSVIEEIEGADGEFLQAVADALKGRLKGVIVLGGTNGSAVALVAAVSPEFTAKFHAGKIIQAIAPIVGGKGGGRPDNARGGGKEVAKLGEALAKAKALIGA